MKRIAIIQSNYVPWKGYFDLIAAADVFILYDDTQFTKRDWRNRNLIKTPEGPKWLTVPVKSKGRFYQKMYETEVAGTAWAERHWNSLVGNYRRARHFEEVAAVLEPLYRSRQYTHLSAVNRTLIDALCAFLGITTAIVNSRAYSLIEGKSARLADLCAQLGGTEYLSGPAARKYLVEQHFAERGIKLSWFDYAGYPEYPQLWGPFTHHVSVLDLLFNCGPKEAPRYMKHVRK